MENLTFRDELNHYKETIDIRDYLERSGYTLDKSRDTPRYRAYKHEGLGDKIYIPRSSKNGIANFYVNQYDNDDKGTLVDFVMSREKKTLDEARLTLREFQHGYVPPKQPQTEVEDDKDKKKRQQYMVQKIATAYPSGLNDIYLERRLLSAATRHHPAFADKVKLNEISDERWIVFPLENEQGKPTGLAMKCDDKEKILGEKSGVWLSQPTLKDHPIDKLVITEHPIDAMSYHQLNQAKLNKQNVVYIATAGNPSNKQLALIQKKIQTLQPKEIVLANDNDQAGEQYNQKYQEKLKGTGVVTTIDQPQFKDWNADVYASVLYQARLMDRTIEDPYKVSYEGKQKASLELEEIIRHKKYANLTERQKQDLPSYYVTRKIEGKTVEFSLKEVALINNDQKLTAHLERHAQDRQMDQAFVAKKFREIEGNVLLNRQEEKAIVTSENPPLIEKRVSQVNTQSVKVEEAFQQAEDHVKSQGANHLQPNPKLQKNEDIDTVDGFMETQRRYNHQIDSLQQQIKGNPAYEPISRKLYYYKNYPHLNDQEVEIYLSIEDKMKTQQQGHGHGLGKQKDREIGI